MKALWQKLSPYGPLTALFAAFLLLGCVVDSFFSARVFSELENRYLKQRPALSLHALLNNEYTPKYEAYINDQFVGRDGWITLKALCETALGKLENNGVAKGEDGYLFAVRPGVDEARLAENLAYVAQFAALHPELSVTAALAPASYTVYPDKLPLGLENIDQRAAIPAAYARLGAAGVQCADLLTPLLAEGDAYLYYRTDHHWTDRGAYLAYRALLKAWGLEPVDYQALSPLRREQGDFLGSYYSKAKSFAPQRDVIGWYELPVTVSVDGQTVDGLYDREQFAKRDKYAALLYGNHGVTVMENPAAPVDGTLLVVKDSYANAVAPFLTQTYRRVVYIDLRSTPALSDKLADYAPDRVLLLFSYEGFADDINLAKLRY